MSAPSSHPHSSWRRHALQTLFWGSYLLLNLILFTRAGVSESGPMMIAVLLSLGLWLGSELLRGMALKHAWLERSALQLVLRLGLAVLLLPLLLQVVIYVAVTAGMRLDLISMPGGVADFRLMSVLVYWINTVILIALWTGGWLGVVSYQRYRQGEMARLRSEAARSTLELNALRARLNPHFVFNALNNVRALINEDPQRARELVTRLSSTLRHALDHSEADSVTVAHELTVVEDYLAVEAVHFEQRLRIVRDIEPASLHCLMPPMLLQLMVENAIKHGIARSPGGGELYLGIRLAGKHLRIEVRNPGDLLSGAGGTGVGLTYLRARVEQQQPPAHFSLVGDAGIVTAVLEIPQA